MEKKFDYISEAKKVFDKEIEALEKTRDALGKDFETILNLILDCEGKLILTGMGKPGHIATKMSATFASLGIPSFFMHPGEAMHGDLGMVEKKDVVMLMSYSGESEEVTRLMPVLKEIGCKTIAITGKPQSTLAQECQYHFFFPEFEEACYLHLAPTSSTTTLLVLGDALAVVASRAINYTRDDFAQDLESTLGANYSQKKIVRHGKKIRLDLWDTAGQEKYRAIGRHFYKDSYIVCLVYDITNKESFERIKTVWYPELKEHGEKTKILALVGNKIDKYLDEQVNEDDVKKYAEEINAINKRTSAMEGTNIEDLFNSLVDKYLKEIAGMIIEEEKIKIKKDDLKNDKQKKKGCC